MSPVRNYLSMLVLALDYLESLGCGPVRRCTFSSFIASCLCQVQYSPAYLHSFDVPHVDVTDLAIDLWHPSPSPSAAYSHPLGSVGSVPEVFGQSERVSRTSVEVMGLEHMSPVFALAKNTAQARYPECRTPRRTGARHTPSQRLPTTQFVFRVHAGL